MEKRTPATGNIARAERGGSAGQNHHNGHRPGKAGQNGHTGGRLVDHPAKREGADGLMPQDAAAELALLASLLMDPDAYDKVREILRPADFCQPGHRPVAEAIYALRDAGHPADIVTVMDELRRSERLDDIGGQAFVSGLTNHVSSVLNVRRYAEIVARCAQQRRRLELLHELASAYYEAGADVDALDAYLLARIEESARPAALAGTRLTLREIVARDWPETRWTVPGILPEGLVLMAAKQKQGKSFFALNLVIAVAAGGVALGQVRVERGEVLYLALEDPFKRIKERTLAMTGGAESVPEGVTVMTQSRRLDEGGLIAIERWLNTASCPRLVVIDIFGKVRPRRQPNGDLYTEDYDAITPLKALADLHHVTILLIHHTRKAEAPDAFDEIIGSTGLAGAADQSMVLKRGRGEGEAMLSIVGRDVEYQELALRFDPSLLTWRLLGDARLGAITSERREILDLLSQRGLMHPREVADALGKNVHTTKALLHKLTLSGLVVSEGGRYTARDERFGGAPLT